MAQLAVRSEPRMETKVIRISSKRQVTIPQKYYELLSFKNEAECILKEDGILIRPTKTDNSDFSEQILADLIEQGFSGQELLARFRDESKRIRPAVEKLIEEADKMAMSGAGKVSMDDIFGTEVE